MSVLLLARIIHENRMGKRNWDTDERGLRFCRPEGPAARTGIAANGL